ncbi:TPA: hypothetical protein DDW35_03810, partial [Candidatus Sumerlaeota bacterium]|nr:hypothetical protein [Candidatus Sumerlaeota bacterium]
MNTPAEVKEDEIGGLEALAKPDVDVVLTPSRERPIAGELWSVLGEITNRSKIPIWIVDNKTVLALAPEMWGLSSHRGAAGAFFPSIQSRPDDEIVRIDPDGKYVVVWKIDTLDSGETVMGAGHSNTHWQVVRRIAGALKDFVFFNPGKFTIAATVHAWTVPPKLNENGYVTNVGDSFPISVTKEIDMEASPWALILGAAIGGMLGFMINPITMKVFAQNTGFWRLSIFILLGLAGSALFCGIVNILVSRLAKTNFFLMIKVNDFWGSIAMGIAV